MKANTLEIKHSFLSNMFTHCTSQKNQASSGAEYFCTPYLPWKIVNSSGFMESSPRNKGDVWMIKNNFTSKSMRSRVA